MALVRVLPLVIRLWSLATGYWLLATGYWLLAKIRDPVPSVPFSFSFQFDFRGCVPSAAVDE
jgi:hypothetical protein